MVRNRPDSAAIFTQAYTFFTMLLAVNIDTQKLIADASEKETAIGGISQKDDSRNMQTGSGVSEIAKQNLRRVLFNGCRPIHVDTYSPRVRLYTKDIECGRNGRITCLTISN